MPAGDRTVVSRRSCLVSGYSGEEQPGSTRTQSTTSTTSPTQPDSRNLRYTTILLY